MSQMATRWLYEGLAMQCCLPKTIGGFRMSIVLPSCRDNARYHRWPHEVKAKVTNWQDVHTMDPRWTHGGQYGHTNMNLRKDLRQYFKMPKILSTLLKLLPNPEKLSRRSHDGLRRTNKWPDLFPISTDVANFLNCLSIASQNRDSMTQAFKKKLSVQLCMYMYRNTYLAFLLPASRCPDLTRDRHTIKEIGNIGTDQEQIGPFGNAH